MLVMTDICAALGLAAGTRIVTLHVDDVAMCHGANQAYLDLYRAGAVDSGSVMVPCPWFPEIAEAARQDRTLDLGVHLTLTSEWDGYRWRAISTTSPASGLVDDDGYLPRNCLKLRARLEPEAAELEMRAQIERALAAGIDMTHLDTHMGAALVPELLSILLGLGRAYRVPVLLPRNLASYLDVLRLGAVDPAPYAAAIAALEAAGAPIVDQFRMTPGVPSSEAPQRYRQLLTTVPAGFTFVALHCNAPGDIESIVPARAHWRTDEYRLFGSGEPRRWLEEAGIARIGYRQLRALYRGAVAA
jgi:chitin disaccharide deacetylase